MIMLPFYMVMLPSWYSKARERIENLIDEIANENNIQFNMVRDSRTIDSGIQRIMDGLTFISENAHPQVPVEVFEENKKTLEKFKKDKLLNKRANKGKNK